MNEIEEVIGNHFDRYPLMQPADAVKLIYQNVFGGGHLITDKEHSLKLLTDEYRLVSKKEDIPITEVIGNGFARINLAAVNENELPLWCINNMFIASAQHSKGNIEEFLYSLNILQDSVTAGNFNFTREELNSYLAVYKEQGYPAVSHSPEFKKAYEPAYRIIDIRYVRLLPIIRKIVKLMESKQQVIIGMDGRAASGKTTAAGLLAEIFDAEIFHMDDFYLPKKLRTEARYAEPGGNVHYERFKEEVIAGIQSNKAFTYRIFDHSIFDCREEITVTPKHLYIVEGAYSMHPSFHDIYDLRCFFDIDQEDQKSRIRKRNGDQKLISFLNIWIPLEEKYLKDQDIRRQCDIILK